MLMVSRLSKCVAFVLILLAFLGIAGNFTLPVNAQKTAEIKVINAKTGDNTFKFYTNTTGVGTRFNVSVYIYAVTDLFAFQVKLIVDDELLNITRAWLPPPDDTQYVFYRKPTVRLSPQFDDKDGDNVCESVLVGDSIMGIGVSGFTGSGILAVIELGIISAPGESQNLSCVLSIDNLDTIALDSQQNDIFVTKTNGFYEYIWSGELPYLEIVPKSYEAKELQDVNFTVWIRRVSPNLKLANITFSLVYDQSLLEVTSVSEGPFLKETGESVLNWSVSNGCLTIMNYLKRGYANASEGVVVTIKFKGIYQDYVDRVSSITFKNIELIDIDGNSLGYAMSQSASYKIKGLTRIIIRLDMEVAYAGSNVTISGWIIPPNEGVDVMIEIKLEGYPPEHKYVNTTKNGNYSYTWKVPSEIEGKVVVFKALFYKDSQEAVESEEIRLMVEKRKIISLSIEVLPANKILVGEDVRIRGNLRPIIEGANITIQYRLKGTTEWKMLAVIKTDSGGSFNYVWPEPDVGVYEIRAYWPGDEEIEASYSNVVSVEIVETLPNRLAGFPFVVVGLVIIAIMSMTVYFKGSERT